MKKKTAETMEVIAAVTLVVGLFAFWMWIMPWSC